MDRNQIIGLVLMLVMLTIYFQYFAEEPEIQEEATTEELAATEMPQEQSIQETGEERAEVLNDSLQNAMNVDKYGTFASLASGQSQSISVENDNISINFSTKGGKVEEVLVKDYVTHDGQPLMLMTPETSELNIWLKSNYRPINISDLHFVSGQVQPKVSGSDTLKLSFTATIGDGKYIEQTYFIPGEGYVVGYDLKLVGLDGIIDNEDAQFTWKDKMPRLERDLKDARQRTYINYKAVGQDVDDLNVTENSETEVMANPMKWIAFKQKFFTKAIIAKNSFKSGTISLAVNLEDSTTVKTGEINMAMAIGDLKSGTGSFQFYFGPNSYAIVKEVTPGFGENVDLGWSVFRYVNTFLIIPIFHFLENYLSSYGLIIILLVIIVRIILSPLTYKSHMSMAKMKVLKPDMDAIKEKHGGDMQKSQAETMQLYQKVGINPLSGCIPMVLQMPILLALFNFFPNSIELRQESFLWAGDLSTYDSVLDLSFTIPFYGDHVSLFTLLMTASTILITWSNSQMNTQMQGPMKTMQYMMPIMFLFFLNSFASGLTFYYFCTNIASFGQMALFKKFIDEDKIKGMLEENRKKNANKKKSSFQSRIEDAMKVSEETRKQKKLKKGK